MEKRLEAEVAVERSKIKAEEPQRVIARSPEAERELRKLEFEAIALESQVRVLFEPSLSEAQKKLNAVAARIKELQAPPEVRQEVQQAEIEKKVDAFRSARRSEYLKELAKRGDQVRGTAREAVAAYERGLRDRLAEATPPPAMTVPRAAPLPGATLPSPKQVAGTVFKDTPSPSLGVQTRVAALRAQRARLVGVITEDVRRRIEGMATQNRWTLISSGGTDLTPRAAELLKEQFTKPGGAGL